MKDFRIPIGSLNERRIGAIVTAIDPAGVECRARVIQIDGQTAPVRNLGYKTVGRAAG